MVELEHVQQNAGGKCGLACLEMIFKYYGISYKKDDIWNSIKEPRQDNQGEFAKTYSLARCAIRYGLNATVYKDSDDTCCSVLDKLEQLNIPAILSVRYKEPEHGHFIAYRGKEDGYYFFNDPDLKAGENPIKYSPHKIIEQWSRNREVAGFVYIVFDGKPITHICQYCNRKYPVLAQYKVPLSNLVPLSNKTVCPFCDNKKLKAMYIRQIDSWSGIL